MDEAPSVVEEPDPIQLELYNNQFASIADEMGITLRNTSSSVNVKERLDFSCAIFTADGDLVVNAPHIPVHLGAMGETVKQLIADNPSMGRGDVFVTNDPFRGGSHLPDITVITPIFGDVGCGEERLFFTASRAHHAEIGGIAPGSMPPFSRTLAEEGVLIRNFRLLVAGESRMDELQDLLQRAPHPSRAVAENLADIGAQMAANLQGAAALQALIERQGRVVIDYMKFIQEAAARKTRMAISRLPDGLHTFEDHLDNGATISVSLDIQGSEMLVDFSGTSPTLETNLNANRAIVTAAVMYALRCMIDEDIPLNQGVLAPVRVELPTCMLNPPAAEDPQQCPPVAGGNVETSQRVVDVLLAALKLAAASQGTMNNLLFGDETFGYYETICGGEGATPTRHGADGVHTHMTNTRITDPEIMEMRYPVRIVEFSLREDSGGRGRHHGGNGIVRRLEFLEPLHVSLLSSRRNCQPFGLQGGEPGQSGKNSLFRADGSAEALDGAAQFDVQPGDQLQIETPGGGGYGES